MDLTYPRKISSSKPNLRIKSAGSRLECHSPCKNVFEFTHRRLDSANAIRLSHQNSSHVMPRRRGDEFSLTSYRAFHDWKNGSLPNRAHLLPSSPTRRNNPHPNLPFLNWQFVSRTHQDRPKIPIANLINSNTNRTHFKLSHEKFENFDVDETTLPSLSDSIRVAFKDENLPMVKQWLLNASPKEKSIIMNMLKSNESQDIRLKSACRDVLNPDVVASVEKWLRTATDDEKTIALKIFEDLAYSSSSTPPLPIKLSNSNRSKSFYDSSLGLHFPSHYGAYKNLPFYDLPDGLCLKDNERKLIWHHHSRRDQAPNVFHRGSLFNIAQRSKGQHWTIHPEWPTA